MTPEHVDELETGAVCRHCGGRVDHEGFSLGGLVEEMEPVEDAEGGEEAETEQHEATEEKRALAFADAVRRRR